MSQPDRAAILEQNVSAWLRTASLRDLVVLLEAAGRELLVQRGPGPVEQAGVDALRAANRLRPLVEVTVTNLTDQPNRVAIGSHAAALEFLDRAAAKYQGHPHG